MTNNPTHGTFPEFVDSLEPDPARICVALREVIRTLHPDFVEIVWPRQKIASYGIGPRKMSEHYAYIAPHKEHVNLGFYYGSSLADPGGRLMGTGKHLRHVRIRHVEDVDSGAIRNLLAEAISEQKSCSG
jgi:hypothetical protein